MVFVFLISFFYHLLVVIWKPLNTTFTLTPCKFCISILIVFVLREFIIASLILGFPLSISIKIHLPSLDWNKIWVTHRHRGTCFPYQQNNDQYWTTFTFFAAPCPSLRHYGSRLLTNMYIFVIELNNFCTYHELTLAWIWNHNIILNKLNSGAVQWCVHVSVKTSRWCKLKSFAKDRSLIGGQNTLWTPYFIDGFTSELEACPNVIKLCLFSSFYKLECADYKVLDSADRNITYGAGWERDEDTVRGYPTPQEKKMTGWYRFRGTIWIRRTIWIVVALKIKVMRIPTSYGNKQNEIVGRVLFNSQVVSLSAITFFTNSNISQLWRILLRYVFLIFVLSLPSKFISITL